MFIDDGAEEQNCEKQKLIVRCMVDEVVEVLRRWSIGETSNPYQEIIVLLYEIIEGMDNIRKKYTNPTKM